MNCERVREAVSARIDGESADLATDELDSHLARCGGCAVWQVQAEHITRMVRLQSVQVPDLTAQVLAAVAADPHAAAARHARRSTRVRLLRVAVALAALVQVALAVPVLIGADLHVGREMATFELAMGVGFGLVAWRPQWVRAFLPVAVVLAAGLAATSTIDIVAGHTTLWHETTHLAAGVQALLLWLLAKHIPAPPGWYARLVRA